MATTEAVLGQVLKRRYKDKIVEGTFLKNRILATIPKEKVDSLGERTEWRIKTAEAAGVGARGSLETLPRSAAEQWVTTYVDMKRQYFTAFWDQYIEKLAKKGGPAFINAVDSQMKSVRKVLAFHIGRQLVQDGKGIIVRLNDATGAYAALDPVTVDLDNCASYGCTLFALPGTLVSIGQEVGGAFVNGTPNVISRRDWSNNVVRFTLAFNAPDNSVVVLGDDQGDSYNKEYVGLVTLIGTGAFQGLDATTVTNNPVLQSYVKAVNGPQNWQDLVTLVLACSDPDDSESMVKDLVVVWHTARTMEHARANEGATMFRSSEMDFPRGFKKPTIQIGSQTVEILESAFWPYEEITCWKKGTVKRMVMHEEAWDTRGEGIVKQMPFKDASWSWGKEYGNFFFDGLRRNTGRLTGVELDRENLAAIMARQ